MSTTTDHLENVFSDTSRSPLRPRPQVDLCRRGEIRAEKFLDAATEVFAEKGYQHARLSEIVARAGGSLATLYRIFGDKEGLASAILERRLDMHIHLLSDLNLTELPPEQALRRVAIRMAQVMARTDSQVVYRIVIGEGGRALRGIGQAARRELEAFFRVTVYLDLRVRVRKDWRRDDRALRELGYRLTS